MFAPRLQEASVAMNDTRWVDSWHLVHRTALHGRARLLQPLNRLLQTLSSSRLIAPLASPRRDVTAKAACDRKYW